MAWGGSIIDLAGVSSYDELPPDFSPPNLGTCEQVRLRLIELIPSLEERGDQLSLVTDFLTLDFSLLSSDGSGDVTSIGVRSNADDALWDYLRTVREGFGASLVDHQTGEIADLTDVSPSSLRDYRSFAGRCRNRDADSDGQLG